MIIDYRKDPIHAGRHAVIDAATGVDISRVLHLIYADDDEGLIRRCVTDDDGNFVVDDAGTGARVVSELRAIRIELRPEYRVTMEIPRIDTGANPRGR